MIPTFSVQPLDCSEQSILAHLEQCLPGRSSETPSVDFDSKRIFVLCLSDHPFVELAREENRLAAWGIAVPMRISVAWVENPFLWWHEALHLFNAKDCYNKFGINKCKEPRCVMQASPTTESCGGRLYLCSKNQRRIATEPIE